MGPPPAPEVVAAAVLCAALLLADEDWADVDAAEETLLEAVDEVEEVAVLLALWFELVGPEVGSPPSPSPSPSPP